MGRTKKAKTPFDNIPQEYKHLPMEGNLSEIPSVDREASQNVDTSLEVALMSPYDPESDEHKIFTLAKEAHATPDEIALILGMSVGFLETEMKDVVERGYIACKILLRRQQLRSAKEGDSKQLTWLGKQILGQEDKTTLDIPMTIVINTGIKRIDSVNKEALQ